jgi:hypothetical protein
VDRTIPLPAPEAGATGPGATGGVVRISVARHGTRLALATTPDGAVGYDLVRADDDGLRLAYADDLVVYERQRALPRIHWAGRARVVPDGDAQLAQLTSGLVPQDTVVLGRASAGGTGDGLPGDVDVVTDDPTRIRAKVTADGDGFLVVSDALQDDWAVTVDGKAAKLEEADHAGVAVAVPAGAHEIVLHHAPRGGRAGLVVSLVTGLLIVVLVVGERYRRRATRAAAPSP